MNIHAALAIIDKAADRAYERVGADEETLEALRCIWRHTRDPEVRKSVVGFKEDLEWHEPIGRSQTANAARNRIRWLLGMKA